MAFPFILFFRGWIAFLSGYSLSSSSNSFSCGLIMILPSESWLMENWGLPAKLLEILIVSGTLAGSGILRSNSAFSFGFRFLFAFFIPLLSRFFIAWVPSFDKFSSLSPWITSSLLMKIDQMHPIPIKSPLSHWCYVDLLLRLQREMKIKINIRMPSKMDDL